MSSHFFYIPSLPSTACHCLCIPIYERFSTLLWKVLLEVYALHLSRDLPYIVGVAPINSTLCNTFHQVLPYPYTVMSQPRTPLLLSLLFTFILSITVCQGKYLFSTLNNTLSIYKPLLLLSIRVLTARAARPLNSIWINHWFPQPFCSADGDTCTSSSNNDIPRF
jgi:hypothetical protein